MHNSINKTINISIDEWLKLLDSGVYSVAKVTPTGNSMWPLIRSQKDSILVKPIDRPLKLGDIVVFKRKDGRSIVHRVYKISSDGKTIETFGDNCIGPDEPVSIDKVYGLVTEVHRGSKVICVDNDKARKAINIYPKLLPIRKVRAGVRSSLKKIYIKVFSKDYS